MATDAGVQLGDFANEMTAGEQSLVLLPGVRIRVIEMADDPDPLQVGSLGTMTAVYDQGDWLQIDVNWNCGRALMLSVPPDRIALALRRTNNTHRVD